LKQSKQFCRKLMYIWFESQRKGEHELTQKKPETLTIWHEILILVYNIGNKERNVILKLAPFSKIGLLRIKYLDLE
jgi:hypothetical protein